MTGARPRDFAPVAIVARSGVDESVHFGAVVGLAGDGTVALSAGNSDTAIFPRSSTKPLQALAMVRAGLSLPSDQLALVCSSHNGETFHLDTARRILEAHGLDTASTICRVLQERKGEIPEASRGLVLVVDDEPDLADAVEVLLQRRGFRTAKAPDGLAGLVAAVELSPDLIVLDYEMPELDGLEVIARLRSNPATQGIPVILASAAKVSMADIRRADGFLAKPFQESLLHDMIDRVLRHSKEARA